MQYTKPQKQAVFDRFDKNVLVSASAGSGKTRVLVDRVINKLLNEHIDIDEMLILTFTKAAAKEMRDRIQTALREQLNQTDNNDTKVFLVKQLRRLPVADISTLDAFCQKIVQNYYYIINLDPNFRLLADQTESQMLKEQVWENVREDLYANDKDDSFAQLTENFSDDRSDDGLTNLVFKTYDYANVNQDPIEWLKQTPNIYDIGAGSITDSDFYQKHLLPIIENEVAQQKLSFESAKTVAEDNGLEKEAACVQLDIEAMQQLLDSLKQNKWDDLRKTFSEVKFKSFPRTNKDYDDVDKATHDRIKNIRNDAKKAFQKLPDKYFALNEADNLAIMQASKKLVDKLVRVVLTFSDSYQQAKLKRHALEFIDVEHYAYDILSGDNAKSKGIREILQSQYNEIMIDEYQDNNRLQDAIISTVAKQNPSNMFMVGDVKQSIYRFRLADPSMFIDRMDNPDDDTIVLPDNFRSAKNIDEFINLIFTQIMDKQIGDIDYTDAAKLKAGAKYPDDLTANVDLLMYESKDTDEEAVDEQFQIQDSAHGQIEIVAQKIDEMINKQMPVYDRKQQTMRPVEYSDIAIISSTRNNNLVLSDIFGSHNIPLIVNGAQSYFKTTEIQIMMALLSIIDNPYQDIPLVAVLRSPIVGLNENQLAYLRINSKTGDYFNAVLKFMHDYPTTADTEFGNQVFEKIKVFLDQLTEFRNIAQQHEIVDLIWHIYQATGFLDYVGGMPAGKQRQANLHALYERAFDYEKTSFKGLFQFVRFVLHMQERNEDLDEANADENTNAVSVMTIHGSKGLEFPVVFLIDASHGFNQQDSKQPYVLNDQLGLGITYLNPDNRVKEDTLQRQVVTQVENRGLLAEEMRKLYVALTRAEQQLFIVGATKNGNDRNKIIDAWRKAAHSNKLLLSNALRSGAKNYLDWIGPALVRHPIFLAKFGDDTTYQNLDKDQTQFDVNFYNQNDLSKNLISGDNADNKEWLSAFAKLAKKPLPDDINVDKIDQIMEFKYPNQVSTQTTAYQSVSEIKRLFEDPDNITLGNYDEDWQENKQSSRYVNSDFNEPQFMQSVSQPSPAEVGTATHLILQELDLSKRPSNQEIIDLIERLIADQVITKEVAVKIDVDEVVKLFDTDLGQLILENHDKLSREAPFSMLMNANLVFKGFDKNSNEKILIHGIIDGYLEFSDHVILFDYKTDYIGNYKVDQHVEKIIEKYRGQINLYAEALSNILHKPVTGKYLYLLSINQAEKID
ncbi:helicase-exonuclease AddAB subunit AddA [Apilactobacillus micheneri]|uniref:helicase-exonuclease AddAB subunit AddA n=1 Tax=Apilactobacillus micheneri TaxID=1899430 RepID=UPI00112E3F84|nr:helicase-exonuclease AddAB subunit AddA [Apilactobacillus micheneri]TPR38985.1 helicase-exonuclease AddAB subunit AddA [Apilactobacillus micheneri]